MVEVNNLNNSFVLVFLFGIDSFLQINSPTLQLVADPWLIITALVFYFGQQLLIVFINQLLIIIIIIIIVIIIIIIVNVLVL